MALVMAVAVFAPMTVMFSGSSHTCGSAAPSMVSGAMPALASTALPAACWATAWSTAGMNPGTYRTMSASRSWATCEG